MGGHAGVGRLRREVVIWKPQPAPKAGSNTNPGNQPTARPTNGLPAKSGIAHAQIMNETRGSKAELSEAMRTFFRFLLRVLFRFRAFNLDALKTPGPVLLIPNHRSWFDWLFLWVCLDDDWKFVASSISAQTSWLHRKVMINRYTLLLDTRSPYAVKRMAEFLKGGGRLVLFAEGRLSRTGALMKLFDGTGFLIFKTRAKVITAYLRGAERHLDLELLSHHLVAEPAGQQRPRAADANVPELGRSQRGAEMRGHFWNTFFPTRIGGMREAFGTAQVRGDDLRLRFKY